MESKRKVYIVGGRGVCAYTTMFKKNGWDIVSDIEYADLIQLTGGEDVTPSYYGEVKHPQTSCNPERDAIEAEIFYRYPNIAIAGICRGGQFLNVMCGGSLYQHVDGHGLAGTHKATLTVSGHVIDVSSTHHQMIRPTTEAEVLLVADHSTYRHLNDSEVNIDVGHIDVEACYYKEEGALCYQPHPEFFEFDHECQITYFEFIEYMLKDLGE